MFLLFYWYYWMYAINFIIYMLTLSDFRKLYYHFISAAWNQIKMGKSCTKNK